MSKIIAASTIRGANKIVKEAEDFLNRAIKEKGEEQKVGFPETAFYLPLAYALLGLEVKTLKDMKPVLEEAKSLLHDEPSDKLWLPYLGDALDSGIATLLAEELIVALRYLYGQEPQSDCVGFYTDTWMRSYGIQLVDGRMPGFAAILGAAPNNKIAVDIVREFQKRNIMSFVGSSSNGKSIIDQLKEENVDMGWETYIVPYGRDTISAIYPLNWAIRAALTFGGLKKGQARQCLEYCKNRVFAFGLVLGPLDDLKYATGAGAINMGFPVIADTDIPEIRPSGICTYEHVVKEFDYKKIISTCIEVRGVKVRVTEIPIPVAYSAAFEGERVRREQMYCQFGGKYSTAFEFVRSKKIEEIEDGKIEVVGPDVDSIKEGQALPLGILVEVAGRKMQKDFEPILERQIHTFLNEAMGIFHMGQRDMCWIRISKDAYKKGFRIKHFGVIIHARLHDSFGAIIDKAQVKLYTKQEDVERVLVEAKKTYQERDERMAGITDESVDTFYSCTLCVPKGEPIVLGDGSFDKIENIIETVADKRDLEVLSFENSHLVTKPVGELFFHSAPKKLVQITTTNNNSIRLTANHKVLVDKLEGLIWTEAGALKKNDRLLSTRTTSLNGRHQDGEKILYLVDLFPDEVKIFDNKFLIQLREAILEKYSRFSKAAKELGIEYRKLYSAFYFPETTTYRLGFYRLTINEIKSICQKIGWDWEIVKRSIKKFGVSNASACELKKLILDEDIMYLAGLIASNGCVRHRGKGSFVQFTNSEKALIDKFAQIVKSLFGVPPKTYTTRTIKSSSKGLTIIGRKPLSVSFVYNPLIGRLMMGLGIGHKRKKGQKNESWSGERISKLSPKLISAFIRGLFDGDGHVTNTHILITTGTYQGAQHIFLLLKKLGISTYITKIKRGYQVGTRSFSDYIHFRETISSHHPRKRKKMEQAKFSFDKNHVVRTDTVPLKCGKILKKLLEKYKKKIKITKLAVDYKSIDAWIKGKCRASKEKLKLLLDSLKGKVDIKDQLYQELLKWAEGNITFEKVKSVEKVVYNEKGVYNFSVPGTHNYLVNGIVTKNCQSFAPNHVCIIKPERLGLCGAYTWLDTKASFELNPAGPNQPVKKGECIDPQKGEWKGVNEFIYQKSNKTLEKFHAYSIITHPETSCCIKDTEVIIEGRPLKIGEFVDKYRGTDEYPKFSALTLNSNKNIREKIIAIQKFPAPQKLVRIKTKSGSELILTEDHKVGVDRPGGITWVEAGRIKEGERVISLKRLEVEATVPDIFEIIPGFCRVRDKDIILSLENKLKEKYGSLSRAFKELNLRSCWKKSLSLSSLKAIAYNLDTSGELWRQIKSSIKKVYRGGSSLEISDNLLNRDLFYILGLLASDGSICKVGKAEFKINFINTEKDLVDIYKNIVENLFPTKRVNLRIKTKSKSAFIKGRKIKAKKVCYDCYTNNFILGAIAEYFGIKVGLNGRWNLAKMVNLPEELVSSFLGGIFDGDGSIRIRKYKNRWDVGEAYFCIEDKKAAKHLQLLLKRFGIVGYLKVSGSIYKVILYGKNLSQLLELIPIRHPQKELVAKKIIKSQSLQKINKAQREVLPFRAGRFLGELPQSKLVFSPSTLFYYKTYRSRAVISNARKVLELLPPEREEKIREFIDTDYFLDTVKEVKVFENRKFKYVYNLTLENIHSYYANDILIANCGCFECIVAILPEANGFMIVNREFSGMTPCGMTFSTLAGSVGGGAQTPGFMGIGRLYIVSKKFISADGGLKRVVWMTKELKEALGDKLKKRCQEEGEPDLIDKIADESIATTSEELLAHLEKVKHPALEMPPLI